MLGVSVVNVTNRLNAGVAAAQRFSTAITTATATGEAVRGLQVELKKLAAEANKARDAIREASNAGLS